MASYPFREFIASPTNPAYRNTPSSMDLCEFPSFVAHTFGVFHLNPLGDHLSSTEAGYLDRFRKVVEAAGSQLVDLGLSGREFSSPAKADRDEAVAYGRHWIDVASLIGSPSVRQHLKTAPGVAPSIEYAADISQWNSIRRPEIPSRALKPCSSKPCSTWDSMAPSPGRKASTEATSHEPGRQ